MSINQKVYEYLQKRPKGKVVTYQQIAIFLGNKNLARTVGNILHKNKNPIKYPCYKVVNKKENFPSNMPSEENLLKKSN